MAPTSEPIRRPEFERYVEDVDRRLEAVEEWQRERDRQDREDRRWRWQQVAAAAAVAATVAGLWLQVTGGR